jgi:hypothetical protein
MVDGFLITDATAHLDRDGDVSHDLLDQWPVKGLPRYGSVQIDHMKSFCAFRNPMPRHLNSVL